MPEESSRHSATEFDRAPKASAPLWRRVPRGWLVLALLIAAWIAAMLVWQGLVFFTSRV